MISATLVHAFGEVAQRLITEAEGIGLTGSGMRKLSFVLSVGRKERFFTALEQTPNNSVIKGHRIIQIRDDIAHVLLGYVDVSGRDKIFVSYESVPKQSRRLRKKAT